MASLSRKYRRIFIKLRTADIETNNCFADANGTEAVPTFKKYACDNNLRFSEETICEVMDVFK